MDLGHAEPADSVTLEVEFDQHHGLPAHNPTVMPRLDCHDLGSLVPPNFEANASDFPALGAFHGRD